MTLQIKKISFLVLIAGITLGLSSCVITRSSEPVFKKKTTTTVQTKHKKTHPHGGPPGQRKKAPGHPGKRL